MAQPGIPAAAPRSDVLRVPARDLTPDWLVDRLAELGPTEELAWHSRVEYKGVGFHIPMIDFVSRPAHSALHRLGSMLATEMDLSGHFVSSTQGGLFMATSRIFLRNILARVSRAFTHPQQTQPSAGNRRTMGRPCTCEGFRGASLEQQYRSLSSNASSSESEELGGCKGQRATSPRQYAQINKARRMTDFRLFRISELSCRLISLTLSKVSVLSILPLSR